MNCIPQKDTGILKLFCFVLYFACFWFFITGSDRIFEHSSFQYYEPKLFTVGLPSTLVFAHCLRVINNVTLYYQKGLELQNKLCGDPIYKDLKF